MLDDLHHLREKASRLRERGHVEEAMRALIEAAWQTHAAESDYVTVLLPLAATLAESGWARGALTVCWYLLVSSDALPAQGAATSVETRFDALLRAVMERARANEPLSIAELSKAVAPIDRARTQAAWGHFERAAEEAEAAGLVVSAAIWREHANDWRGARALWSRLARSPHAGQGAYQAALVQFNLARSAKRCGDERQARDAFVAAVRLLEEAADHFESVGVRERAFDCFQVLIQIGREARTFEDVLEGLVNCIRILREDHLKFFALQHFEQAVSIARDAGELNAAATLAREAADYARTLGLGDAATYYSRAQAELLRALARQQVSRGAPPELAENALLAAVLAFGEIGQFQEVGVIYTELSQLDLDASRKRHYEVARRRYDGVQNEDVDSYTLPSHLKGDGQFPDVWHVDLLEWEQAGSAAEACAEVLFEKKLPDLYRRKAMLTRLTALELERNAAHSPETTSDVRPEALARLADQLGHLQLYGVLSPLERLFEHPDRLVKVAVLNAICARLFFKRSFVTVRAGLRHADPSVVEQASRALETLYFPHAFDPLSRIVREMEAPSVRASAVKALAKIDSDEAAEFLLELVQHGAPSDRAAAVEGLKRSRATRFTELARTEWPTCSPEVQASLREVLRAHGIFAG